ncbi:MAG: esterase family protein [Clostridia bacterium]|nr:esterase family protein [Oscillospiraceae bacterium]MBR4893122.1 esterase family protein [Clostridia bacterium]
MALCELKFFSEALQMHSVVNVIIPQSSTSGEIGTNNNTKNEKYKCLYLLHGLSDDESIWLRRTSIERYANRYGVCVVMPCGGRSFYTDMKYGGKYYTYIAEEVPKVIGEFFNVSDKREDTYIAGQSMGGYGALKIALKNPDRFCACAGLSSVADIENMVNFFKDTLVPIFGEDINIPEDENLFHLAKKCNSNPLKPRIYMGVGTEDFLYEDNVKFKEFMEKLDYDYTYQESEGIHTWDFWDVYIPYALDWMFK